MHCQGEVQRPNCSQQFIQAIKSDYQISYQDKAQQEKLNRVNKIQYRNHCAIHAKIKDPIQSIHRCVICFTFLMSFYCLCRIIFLWVIRAGVVLTNEFSNPENLLCLQLLQRFSSCLDSNLPVAQLLFEQQQCVLLLLH